MDTSHLEISPLNDNADVKTLRMLVFSLDTKNNQLMSVTAETSQNPIGPCGPLEHLLDTFRHSTMANRRLALNFGGHAVVGYYCRGGWGCGEGYNND